MKVWHTRRQPLHTISRYGLPLALSIKNAFDSKQRQDSEEELFCLPSLTGSHYLPVVETPWTYYAGIAGMGHLNSPVRALSAATTSVPRKSTTGRACTSSSEFWIRWLWRYPYFWIVRFPWTYYAGIVGRTYANDSVRALFAAKARCLFGSTYSGGEDIRTGFCEFRL